MIEMFNELGQKILISRSEYIDKVLPYNLQLHWNNPDELASAIMTSFSDGLFTHVEAAAKRLVEIDTISERSICLYGTVLLNTKKYVEAEKLFLNHLNDHPRHPYILTNLAKAQDFLGKNVDALITLEESITADPNQKNAMQWWLGIKIEELEFQGLPHEQVNLNALEQADKRFGGWRVKLWLGEYFTEINATETARLYYEDVLSDEWEPDVLSSISGALGKHGYLKDVIKLIAPRYDPYQHEIGTGFNLLQAYLKLKQVSDGQQLLNKLYSIYRPDLDDQLDWYKLEFAKLIKPIESISEEHLDAKFESINYPLWCYGWNIKHGFDSVKTDKKIAIFQFSWDSGPLSSKISVDLENTQGRLARAIPLFLLEDIYYGTDASSTVIFPISKDNNCYVLYGNQPSTKQIMELSKQGYDGVVIGEITSNTLTVTYWDLQLETRTHHVFLFDLNEPEKNIPQIEQFIFEKAGILFDANFKKDKRGFQPIPDHHRRDYLMLISQHLSLYNVIKSNEIVSEHDLIRRLLKLAEDVNIAQVDLNMIAIIQLCIDQNSLAIKDYIDVISRWLNSIIESKGPLHGIATKTANKFEKYCNLPGRP